jgi:hypothetical protein
MAAIKRAGRGYRNPENSESGMTRSPAGHFPLNRAKSR